MSQGKSRVLIVENDPVIATDIKKFLQSKNYNVISVVRQGDKAIEKARKEIPDIVIMDIMLDGNMNGIEAAETISKENKIPVIFLTALNDDETFLSSAETKPYGFITKPFNPDQLEKAISSALKGSR